MARLKQNIPAQKADGGDKVEFFDGYDFVGSLPLGEQQFLGRKVHVLATRLTQKQLLDLGKHPEASRLKGPDIGVVYYRELPSSTAGAE